MKAVNTYWIIAISLLIALSACNKGIDDEETIVPKYLVDRELIESASLTSANINTALNFYGLTELANKAKYDIKVYKIVYYTLFEGDSTLVSGIISVPVPQGKDDKFPVMSYQHGTLFEKADAPTENIQSEFMTYVASMGMVVVIADYIGFGASDNVFPPYMINEYTVNTVLDMIRASKEFIQIEKPCAITDQLYLFGYSQGGSATVGALSAIENNPANSDLAVTAASAGGGAYDLNQFRNWIVEQQRYEKPSFITYILESYSHYANVDIDYSLIFNDEFAQNIPGLIDMERSESAINSSFGTFYVDELFYKDFKNDSIFENDPAYASLRTAFNENTIGAWPLSASLALYFGTDDIWVPGEQSIRLYQQFQQENVGAKIKFKQLSGKNHSTAFVPALLESIDWFLGY